MPQNIKKLTSDPKRLEVEVKKEMQIALLRMTENLVKAELKIEELEEKLKRSEAEKMQMRAQIEALGGRGLAGSV